MIAEYAMVIIHHVPIVQVFQMVMQLKINVAFVIMIHQMIVFLDVQMNLHQTIMIMQLSMMVLACIYLQKNFHLISL